MEDNKKQNNEMKTLQEIYSENNTINKGKFGLTFSKSKILSKLLNEFSQNELNKYFDIMSSDLINYRIAQESADVTMLNKITFKNVLFDSLEKHLIEIIYINQPIFREETITRLYNWYKEQIKRFEDVRYINKKTFKDIDSFDDEEYYKEKFGQILKEREYLTEDQILKEQMNHRSKGNFDKNMLKQYKRVQVYKNPFFKKIYSLRKKKNKEKEDITKPIVPPTFKRKLSPPSPIKNMPGDYSHFYSILNKTNSFCVKKNNDNKYIEKPEGGEKEKSFLSSIYNKKTFYSPKISKEIKASYSFNRPPIDFNILNVEKEIIDNKNEVISEKRGQEEINKNIENYGAYRAKFKGNILKKYEMRNIINMYIKTKKLNTQLLQKYINKNTSNILSAKENNLVNETFSKTGDIAQIKLTSKNPIISNISQNNVSANENIEKNNFQLNMKRHHSIKKKVNIKSPQKDKKDINNKKNLRNMKRHHTFGVMKISKKFRTMGKKLVLEGIKNLDKETNEIIDQSKDKIYFYNLKLKYPKESNKQKLLISKINSENENSKTPYDITYKLISTQPLFRQKIISDNLCSINAKMNDKRFQSKISEEESIYHNFCLSAYNPKNLKIIDKINKNKMQKEIKILRHISPCVSKIGKKKLINENDSFNNYKDDYLTLRKTIGEWKKYEFEQLINKINNDNNIERKENESLGLYIEKNNKYNNDALENKINHIKYQKQNNLMNAIINPNENNSFPTYYLPKTGKDLLSRIENIAPKKKKNKK